LRRVLFDAKGLIGVSGHYVVPSRRSGLGVSATGLARCRIMKQDQYHHKG
jgi:hypothetical protein